MASLVPVVPSPLPAAAGTLDFDDFEAISSAAPDWNHTHLQIGRGRAHARVTVAQTGQMLLAVVGRSPGFLERGTPPRGAATFTVNLRGERLQAQRRPWERECMGVVPSGVEYELLSTGPSTLFVVALDQNRLDEESRERWGQRFPTHEAGPCLRFRDGTARNALVATWVSWLKAARRSPGILSDPEIAACMEKDVLQSILEGLAPSWQEPPPRPYRVLALRVESFIRRSLEEQITVEDICRATQASARSVHASFQSVYGMPPKAYWKALRLSRAREDLRRAKRGTTVSEVASRWSFFRFGYFSNDYREAFGENPSDTLQRATGRRAANKPPATEQVAEPAP